jgi:CRISPR-associated endonuclease/helicase Cas3
MGTRSISRSSPLEFLDDHAREVGGRAREAARIFGADTAGLWSGILHDLGKEKRDVQDMLRGRPGRTSHAAEGARWAHSVLEVGHKSRGHLFGQAVAHAIAGHHAGLHDGRGETGLARLIERAATTMPPEPPWLRPLLELPDMPGPYRDSTARHDGFVQAFFIRMLFSALIDADRSAARRLPECDEVPERLDPLRHAHERHVEDLAAGTSAVADLATFRSEVMRAALAASRLDPGLFSMTVPTGGGKTMASLGFALAHAREKGLRRIVYAAPFTAIVEQTADAIRRAVGEDEAVLEHHSATELEEWTGEEDEEASARRDAEARWDTPIVVTTAVQLFESLFSARPGRCRKLHRLARSVVILDEGQALPPHVLKPCLAAISELARGYGASVLLMTATQPMVRAEDGFPACEALQGVREIGPAPDVACPAPRVRARREGTLTDDDLLARIEDAPRSLTILNNRRHARELFAAARAARIDGIVHLSTAMIPAHRRLVLDRVRASLKRHDGAPCRLISTSVVEAGVDIDFPVVLRAIAGIDQIAQAAGRCNREGLLGREGGTLILFDPEPGEGRAAPPRLKLMADEARAVLDAPMRDGAAPLDPLSDEALRSYFANRNERENTAGGLDDTWVKLGAGSEVHGILKALREASFDALPLRSVGIAFRMVEEAGAPVVVPESYGIGAPPDLLEALRTPGPARGLARRLQPYCVSVPRAARAAMRRAGHLVNERGDEFGEAFPVLVEGLVVADAAGDAARPTYDAETGLDWVGGSYPSGERLMF